MAFMFKSRLTNLIILILGLFLIVNLTRSIYSLLKAGDKLKEEEKKVAELKYQNDELKNKLSEVQSPSFLEKMAREKLGLAKEGETVVILPSILPQNPKLNPEEKLANWQKWWRLFF